MRSVLFVALGLLAVNANSAVVASFAESRLSYPADLRTSDQFRVIRGNLAFAGHTTREVHTLTASSLFGVDVLFTSSFGDMLSAAEQQVLTNWVAAGGTLFSSGEYANGNIQDSFNTILNPFGLALEGTARPVSGPSYDAYYTVTDTNNAIIDGSFGLVSDINMAGTGYFRDGNYQTLAVDYYGNTVMLRRYFGAGQVVAIGDHNAFTYPQLNELTLFMNVIESSATVVPIPAAAWLFISALAGLGAIRRRHSV